VAQLPNLATANKEQTTIGGILQNETVKSFATHCTVRKVNGYSHGIAMGTTPHFFKMLQNNNSAALL
jgi:hypothetical protein